LRSGAVNWIEAPNPDDIAALQSSGFQITANSYDHDWPWILDMSTGPLADVRVRQALNYAIDRDAMAKTLLHGTADPAAQLVPRSHQAYSADNDTYDLDLAKARSLLKAAGYADGFPLVVQYPTSGSGNMQPTPMNEELQGDLAKVGVKVQLKPVEWAALLGQFLSGKFPEGVNAVNVSLPMYQESIWNNLFQSGAFLNEGGYSNPDVDALLKKAASTVDRDARYALLTQASALITKDAPWLFVVNDRNPRAMSNQVHDFVQPRSWFVDLTQVYVGS
jgi:peptide/nickel transport system substrate-binding protein